MEELTYLLNQYEDTQLNKIEYWFNIIIKDNTTYCDNHIFYNYGH